MSRPAAGDLRVRVAQTAPRRLDVEHNRRTIETLAAGAADDGVDLLVFPELALTGYDVGGRAPDLARDLRNGTGVTLPPEGPVAVLGMIERGDDHLLYNAAVAARGREVLHVHRKIHLPTYGTFDEGRIFAPGRKGPRSFETPSGWRVAPLVCEELWHPATVYLAALGGAEVLVVLAAPAGRGEPTRGRFATSAMWELLARTAAATHGVWVVLANHAGVEGSLTFAGGSLIVGPDGEVLARASEEGPDRLDGTLERAAVGRARRPWSHLRDEDPGLVSREIERILRERAGREGP